MSSANSSGDKNNCFIRQQSILEDELKNAFRKQAIAHGVADECVIDKDTYAEISDVSGCFRRNNAWIVYETDDRGQVCNEKSYTSVISAYRDLAGRLDFLFNIPMNILSEGILLSGVARGGMVAAAGTPISPLSLVGDLLSDLHELFRKD